MNRTLKIVLIVIGVFVVLVVIAMAAKRGKDKTSIEYDTVKLRTITETVSASGKIQPESEVKITSEVSGQIVNLPVKEGDFVAKGQLLLQINPDIYKSALNRAQAALNTSRSNLANSKARNAQVTAQFVNAQQSFNRSKKLFDQSVISAAEWDTAVSTFDVATAEVTAASESVKAAEFAVASGQATLTEASDNLSRTEIMAPQSGIVTALAKEEGEGVVGNQMMAGEVIMKISNLSRMEVNVEVNESDIVRVTLGDTAIVEVDAYQDDKFKGIVTEIGNTALNSMGGISMDQVTNFSVKVLIMKDSYEHIIEEHDSTYAPFRPGMSATVDVQTATAMNVITIPIKAVTTRTDTASSMSAYDKFKHKQKATANKDAEDNEPLTVVFTLDDSNTAQLHVVETGVQDNKYIYIKSGLSEGDKVITDPYRAVSKTLKHGEEVEVKSYDYESNSEGEE